MTPQSGPQHVLVLEDDPAVRDLLRELLEDHGYRVSALAAAPRGPAEVERIAPDLIVLDVLFGGAPRGFELLRRLRSDPGTADIPVVVCTGAVEWVRALRDPLAAQLAGMVLKPFDIDELLSEIGAAWERKAARAAGDTEASGARPPRPRNGKENDDVAWRRPACRPPLDRARRRSAAAPPS